jgi:cobalamin biosynthesis Mg chelatase CobN
MKNYNTLDLLNADGLDDCIKQNYSNAIGIGMFNSLPLDLKDFFNNSSPEKQSFYMTLSVFDRAVKIREDKAAADKAAADKANADKATADAKAAADLKVAADKAAADAKAIADKSAAEAQVVKSNAVIPRKINDSVSSTKKETESLGVAKVDSKKDESDEEEVEDKKSSKKKSSKKESGEEPKKFLGMPKAIGITVVSVVGAGLLGLGAYLIFRK